MIPLRVYLKGFMSYRDEAVLTFDGAPLWVLTGQNGAGKSAVFDAITFALYGKHRAGKQNHTDLINHQADQLVVEFDFSIGEDVYRVKRIVSKKGKSDWGAFHLQGPNAPYSGKNKLQPIPGTDNKAGFADWVSHNIGLDEETFTASILLQQGRSEAMLEAIPSTRHKMLSELVDISEYEHLAQRAKNESNKYKGIVEGLDIQLRDLNDVNDTELNELDKQISILESAIEEVQDHLEELEALKVHAGNWQKLTQEQEEITRTIEKAQPLLDNAEQIEQEARRLAELQQVLSKLKSIFHEHQRLLECQDEITNQKCEATRQEGVLTELEPKFGQAQTQLKTLINQQEEQQRIQREADQTLQNTESDHLKLERIEVLRQQMNKFEEDMARLFPDDLDERVKTGQTEVKRLRELSVNLPYLHRFRQERSQWLEFKNQGENAEEQLAILSDQLETTQKEHEAIQSQHNQASSRMQKFREGVTTAQTLLNEVKDNISRFQEVEGHPNCYYCGQQLTPEHLSSERTRLENERNAKAALVEEAEHLLQTGEEEAERWGKKVQDWELKVKELTSEAQRLEQEIKFAQQNQKGAEIQAGQAVRALSENYKDKITQSDKLDIFACLVTEYPSKEDLHELEMQARLLSQYEARLEQRLQEQKKRDVLRERQRLTGDELLELETNYPENTAREIINARQAAEAARENAKSQLKQLQEDLELAQGACKELESDCEKTRNRQQKAIQQIDIEQTRFNELQRSIARMTTALPPDWQSVTTSLTETQLQNWELEENSLMGADERKQQLLGAQHLQKSRQDRLLQVDEDLTEIPEKAKRPLTDLNTEEANARQEREKLQTKYNNTQATKRDLEKQQETKRSLEKQRREANKKAGLYKELASLFGRDNLQRYLLQQVEHSIVHHANEVLDRISGGTLRLDLRETASSSGNVKALDIVAYNSQLGQDLSPIPVSFLSGSQRFRVAVSLALGIGRYMSQGSYRVESVIIDEGFGGLDKDGRDQIIDELHELKHELSRIILVSHQEEFASAFREHGYEITLANGTSVVNSL